MNNRQKLIQKQFLNNEEAVIERLNKIYTQSLIDIEDKIKNLTFSINDMKLEYSWMDDDDPKKAQMKSMIQSKIYQRDYQEQLKRQVDGILQRMNVAEFTNIADYLDTCYTDGYIGTVFDAFGQGVPFFTPINQEAMVRAVQLESKISQGLYTKLGQDVNLLKERITSEVSRGIATGKTYAQVAKQLENQTRIGFNKAVRIARTEGHRVQTTATMDAMESAKAHGADVVKQWSAALDRKTRESHQQVDHEIRELDKPFSNGLMYPGDPSGGASEVVNCRCALLQRARKIVESEDKVIRMDNETGELIECKNYAEFKEKYLSNSERQSKINYSKLSTRTDKEQFERYKKVLGKNSPQTLEEFYNLKYNKKDDWEKLKNQYRIVNKYEVDGKVSANEILELHNVAYNTKKNGFDVSSVNSKMKRKITTGGNAATMRFDGKTYFSHSRFGETGTLEHSLYVGKYPTVALSPNRIFEVLDLGDGKPRQYDTEAKFLEFVATQKKPTDKFSLTILSEKHICDSCQHVVKQFKSMYPNATVNIVSGKQGYNGDPKGGQTWKQKWKK